ncbi:response regulator [Pacificibacter marinus]|uniref:Response regulatory domain-containing protein n=1 Tax=Pacificibacter marinus TaxID=658057 RepID=A0A1Y5RFT4_9RHOB|nr:response regulator [Pacificibacter marinus]SEK21311.1 Response regulator receiver domain-containing protein [Pacificibacter marinus]SLN16303.1 hypothetical protein PAM7971_00334 [Pacificibacter marinus]
MTLLVVDDDEHILDLMDGILSSLGHEDVIFASNGREALGIIQKGQYDFSTMFLDIQMPGMSGIDLCASIRKLPEHRRTPIIMLTSMKDKAHIDASFMKGATDYLTKPVDVTELGARLRVAQLLHEEQQRSEEAVRREESLRLGMNEASHESAHFRLSDPVNIYDVPRVIGSLEMENYLHRLSRVKRFMFGALGFKIRKVETLYALSSPIEFHCMLTDVAEALFENIRVHDAMISYLGNGEFIAILPRALQIDRNELETNLALTLHEFGLVETETVPMGVSLSVGEVVKMSMFDTTPQKLFEKALEKTDARKRSRNKLTSFSMIA